MVRTLAETREHLNDLMQFDHVIEVHPDGTVTEPRDTWAPEVIDSDGTLSQGGTAGTGWSLLNGYSGQDRYAGPVMHQSECIGGVLADDILSQPGQYVALIVPGECDEVECEGHESLAGEHMSETTYCDGSCNTHECDGCDPEPAGWAIAYRETGE